MCFSVTVLEFNPVKVTFSWAKLFGGVSSKVYTVWNEEKAGQDFFLGEISEGCHVQM